MKRNTDQLRRLRAKFWWALFATILIWLVGGLLFGYAFGGGSGTSSQEDKWLEVVAIVGSVLGTLSFIVASISIVGIVATSILIVLRRRIASADAE